MERKSLIRIQIVPYNDRIKVQDAERVVRVNGIYYMFTLADKINLERSDIERIIKSVDGTKVQFNRIEFYFEF